MASLFTNTKIHRHSLLEKNFRDSIPFWCQASRQRTGKIPHFLKEIS